MLLGIAVGIELEGLKVGDELLGILLDGIMEGCELEGDDVGTCAKALFSLLR
jgi:hypothetical protein